MKLTVMQLLEAAPVIQSLGNQPAKGRVAFKIRRLFLKLAPEIANAEAARNSLVNDTNSDLVDETTGTRKIKPKDVAKFLGDPLFKEIIEVDAEPLVPGDLDDFAISPAQINSLGPLLKED